MQAEGYCECGCGQRTTLAKQTVRSRGLVKGQPNRFLPGHMHHKASVDYVIEDRGYETPCWVWQRAKSKNGYGTRHASRGESGTRYVHVQNWVAKHGPVPDGLELDHLCRVRACVNSDHLEPVTRMENIRRGSKTKLTVDKATEIRNLIADGWLVKDVAAAYGISDTLASDVRNGRRWSAW